MSDGPYSYETGEKKILHMTDYAVFGATLAVSAAIGIFYAVKDRNRNTTEEYLLAGRSMHYIPVGMSLLSSFISAIAILGTPAEVYVYSTMYGWITFSFIIMSLGAAHIFIPVFYNLGITSVFQYVEMRFGPVTRTIASITYLILMMFYMAIVLYAPSLALNAVTGLSLWGSVIAVGLVCIFYTTLGGMKAVLWADTVQMVLIYAGMITILVEGSIQLGGFDKAWDIANKNDRIVFSEFDTNPALRHSVWNIVIGGSIGWCAVFGTNQAQVQRAMSVTSLKRAQIAIWLNLPGMASIIIIACLVGIVMYAFYAKCDPVTFGLIAKNDQMVALYMMDLLGDLHGVAGLFLSCVFSGSLSTVSSGLSALSAVVLEDFLRPYCCNKISPVNATLLSKGLVVLFGLMALAIAFFVSQAQSMIVQMVYSLFGVLGGPLFGMFTLGILFPWANKWGGCIGLSTGLVCLLWLGLGTAVTNTSVVIKSPMSLEGCNWNLTGYSTLAPQPTTTGEPIISTSVYDKYSGFQTLYTLSYQWYSALALCIVVVVGLITSLVTGLTDTKTLNPKLICPVFDIFFPFLPERIRKPLRFGVRHGEVFESGDHADEKNKHALPTMNVDVKITAGKGGKYRNTQTNGTDNVAYNTPIDDQYNTKL